MKDFISTQKKLNANKDVFVFFFIKFEICGFFIGFCLDIMLIPHWPFLARKLCLIVFGFLQEPRMNIRI